MAGPRRQDATAEGLAARWDESSYAAGATSVALQDLTIGAALAECAKTRPDDEALRVPHRELRLSYGDLRAHVLSAARALVTRGVRHGDRVGIWATNCPEWVILQYAVAEIGAILVPLNPGYRAKELEFVLNDAGITVLVMSRRYRSNDLRSILSAARTKVPVDSIVIEDDWDAFIGCAALTADAELERLRSLVVPDDIASIQYTSGTTGSPKGAMLTHFATVNNARLVGLRLGMRRSDRLCLIVPLLHAFGNVMAVLGCLASSSCLVIAGEIFRAETALDVAQRERCTVIFGVPTMFVAMLAEVQLGATPVTTLRTGLMSGAPCPRELMLRVQSDLRVPQICVCYGMTETSPVAAQSAPNDSLEIRTETVGHVLENVEIRVSDPHSGKPVPLGHTGEVCIRGFGVMRGYWGNAEMTAAAIDGDGWMHTGDLGILRNDGNLQITGRLKDLIIRGGENIDPREIEDCVLEFGGLLACYVVGIPSEVYGEEVVAWVQPSASTAVTISELRRWCEERLAPHKVPRYWKVTDALPMTTTGKVQKYRLRERSDHS